MVELVATILDTSISCIDVIAEPMGTIIGSVITAFPGMLGK